MKRGFTLTEVLITIAIIGIISAIMIPSISTYLPSIQLNGDANTILATLRQAQEKTITEQKNYLVHFYPTASPYYDICHLNGTAEEGCISTSLSGRTLTVTDDQTPPNQINDVFSSPTVPITYDRIVFSPDGGPSSKAKITLSIPSTSTSKIISVSPAGFIQLN